MKDYYTVWFTNLTECVVGISDISWCVTVAAGSEAEAFELGLRDARALNAEFGLPPHRTRVSDTELRRLARVQPMGRL